MFDNLRDFSDTPLYEDEQNDLYKEPENASFESSPATPVKKKKKNNQLLGMTAQQRFILAVMLMFTVAPVSSSNWVVISSFVDL